LFDMDGKLLKRGPLAGSGITLDPANNLFYGTDPYGYLRGRRLADGFDIFKMEIYFGSTFIRTFIVRHGREMFITGTYNLVNPHGGDRLNMSVIELQDLGDAKPDENGFLISQRLSDLVVHKGVFLTAILGDRVFLTTTDHLFVANSKL